MGGSLGLGPRGSLSMAHRALVAQILDLHHQLSAAVRSGVNRTMLAGIVAITAVTLSDLVGEALEVLRPFPLR